MAEGRPKGGMVGLFWVVAEGGEPAIIAPAVTLRRTDAHGDMLTLTLATSRAGRGLCRRGGGALRAAQLPTAPVWSEDDEWPRVRVLYHCAAQRSVVRADRQLH